MGTLVKEGLRALKFATKKKMSQVIPFFEHGKVIV
jgi:hypothetical protein